jgi:hypothetical protein
MASNKPESTSAPREPRKAAEAKYQLWIYFGTDWRCAGFFDSAKDARDAMEKDWPGFRRQATLVAVEAAEL